MYINELNNLFCYNKITEWYIELYLDKYSIYTVTVPAIDQYYLILINKSYYNNCL